MKPDLIELSHQLEDLVCDLRGEGCWDETLRKLSSAYDTLIEQIDEEGLEDE